MKNQKKYLKVLIYLFLILNLSSCVLEKVKIAPKQKVIIYSDCLNESQIDLFKQFTKKEHVKVVIINLPTDTIIKRIADQKFNTKADVILLKSLVGTNLAAKKKLFQSWKSWKMDELVQKNYKSKNNTWFAIGVDPYVFIAKNDTLATMHTIGDLLYPINIDKWSSNLETTSDLTPLIAPILKKKTKMGAKDWFSDFIRNQHSQNIESDENGIPIMTTNVLLTNYTSYIKMSERNDSSDLQLQLIFTNQNKRGAFFNAHCIGIVKQARNFNNAKLLVEYITSAETNEKLNNYWKTFPISLHTRIHPFAYQNTYYKIASISSERMMLKYSNLENIISKSNKE